MISEDIYDGHLDPVEEESDSEKVRQSIRWKNRITP